MARQESFPPKGWTTRRIFVGVIALLALGMLLASVFGPVVTLGDGDPRPWAAAISAVTYIGMIVMVAWLGWMVLRPRRSERRDR